MLKIFFKYFYFIFGSVVFLCKPTYESEIDINQILLYIVFFLFATILHFSKLKSTNWFRLDVLFIIGFFIVHFQWPIMYVFSGINPQELTPVIIDTDFMNYGTWLSTLGGVAWLSGYHFFPFKKNGNRIFCLNYEKLFWVTVFLNAIFVINAGDDFLSGGVYKGSGGSNHAEGIGVYFQILSAISIFVLTTFVILDSKKKYKSSVFVWIMSFDKKYLILTIAYISMFILIGDRGGAAQLVLCFLVLFGEIIRPIKFIEFFLMLVFGSIVLTLIGLGRSSVSGENIFISGFRQASFSSKYDATLELAGSARALYKAVSYVPKYHDFFYGKLWASDLMAVIPFVQNYYLSLSHDAFYELNSSDYITYLTYGLNPSSGEGSSIVADLYLNFGCVGVFVFLFFLGVFYKKVQNEIIRQRYYWIVVAAFISGISIYFSRSGLFTELRPAIWGLILSFFFFKKRGLV